MLPADAAAFGADVERLQALGPGMPPGVRAGWTLLRVFDGVLIVVLTLCSLVLASLGMAVLPIAMVGFGFGLGIGIMASAAVRRRVLTPLYRALTRQLDATPGAVGGSTSAAMPVLFTKPVLTAPPPKHTAPVRPVRVGDPDALDFDDGE
jgi:hypothetical protein